MKKKTLYLICTLLAALMIFPAAAQATGEKITIKGLVTDTGGEPEAFATVAVYRGETTEGTPVATGATGEDGIFSLKVDGYGKYTVFISSVGKQDKRQTFGITASGCVEGTFYTGKTVLEESAESLKAVVLTEQQQFVKNEIDKMSYNVADDPDSKNSTALDMLRKVPRITVDGNDGIMLNGSGSFQIYVNGRPTKMFSSEPGKILKSMPASAIKKIEVISDPGAKYDADGIGGILNIVMNTGGANRGYSGALNAGVSEFMTNATAHISASTGRLSVSANYTYVNNRLDDTEIKTSTTNTADPDMYSSISDMSTDKNRMNMHIAGLEASYEIDSENFLSISGNYRNFISDVTINAGNLMTDKSGATRYFYRQILATNSRTGSGSVNIGYQNTSKKNPDRIISLSYMFNTDPQKTDNNFSFSEKEGIFASALPDFRKYQGKATTNEHIAQFDYTDVFSGKHTVEAGLKYTFRNNFSSVAWKIKDTENGQWEKDPANETSDYTHGMHIGAAYASYGVNLGKFGLKAGIRDEYTLQDIKYRLFPDMDFDTGFNNLVPSLTLSWQPSMMQSLKLTYNMRITRPGITYLNPFVNETSPNTIQYGNPEIESERNHTVALEYGSFSPAFNINMSLRYSFTDNTMDSYSFMDEDGILNTTYGNIGRSDITSINTFINWNPGKMTRIILNGDIRYEIYNDLKNNIYTKGQRNEGLTGNLMLSVQQSLPLSFRIMANGGYAGPTIQLQNKGYSMFYYVLSVSKGFFNDKFNITLSGVNLHDKYLRIKNRSTSSQINTLTEVKTIGRQVMLNLSCSFGNYNAQVKKIRRATDGELFKEVKSGSEKATSQKGI